MDFFEHQEKARKNSHVLILYFVLAVVGIILAVYSLALGLSFFFGSDSSGAKHSGGMDFWNPGLLALTSSGTGALIFLASAYKTSQLNGGGKVVAQELGGRLLDPHSTDLHERRLLNVVEEMAIASGVPVPEVYVMDGENSINAFAAGKTTSDAVIGVTRGCMKMLSRDELQGVIAHEFSHILNGDMRLNMRLIGLLFGILFITLIGQIILRGSYYGGGGRSRDSGGAIIAIILAGVGLIVIGYVGMFFANLIKASISRQREFLADASAVQFTRNPDGIAGALRKIGALQEGAVIQNPMAQDASHLFFGSALSGQLFATHPPLTERIRRLLPNWDGDFGAANFPSISERGQSPKKQTASSHSPIASMLSEQHHVPLTDSEAVESLKTLHPEQVELGGEILNSLPKHWLEAAHSESGAQSLVFALLLSQDGRLREQELNILRQHTDSSTSEFVESLFGEMRTLHSAVKLALVDLSLPAFRRLSPGEYDRFKAIMEKLVTSDQLVDLFEFTLQTLVSRHLDRYFQRQASPRIAYRNANSLAEAAEVLLSTLAVFSNPGQSPEIEAAFSAGAEHFEKIGSRSLDFQPAEKCGLRDLQKAIERFEHGTPSLKKEFLHAASKTVLRDQKMTSSEAELIRAIADAMGCGIPPFLKTAELA